MSTQDFDCQRCTNKAARDNGWMYCLPMISGHSTPETTYVGGNERFHHHCPYYTTGPRTPAIYEIVVAARGREAL